MKISELEDLYNQFYTFQTLEELAVFFNNFLTKKRNYPRPSNFIKKKDLTFYLYVKKKSNYESFKIPKRKDGEFREIFSPLPKLKVIQRVLNELFQYKFTPKGAAHGFIKNKSIVTNAKQHINRKYVYNIDLENFFPSINFGRVKAILKLYPLKLNDEQARIIASLCCNEGKLTQGSPTSPVISNMACRRLDSKLSQLAKKYKARFTRYADDITFSSNKNIFNEDFLMEITKIIKYEGFKINKNKTRLQTLLDRQIVTGLVVNKKLKVQPKYKRDLRFIISFYRKNEIKAQNWLNANYFSKRYDKKNAPKIENYIEGKLNFYKMVVGENNATYISLDRKFKNIELHQKEIADSLEKLDSNFKKLNSNTFQKNNYELLISNHINLKILEKNKYKKINRYLQKIKDFQSNNHNIVECEISTSIIDRLNKKAGTSIEHEPIRLSAFLYNCRKTTHILGEVLHSSEALYEDIIHRFEEFNNKELNSTNKFLPESLKIEIRLLLSKLKSDERRKQFSKYTYKSVFKEISPLIKEFKQLIRLGTAADETKISELIQYILSKDLKDSNKFWRIEVDEDVDSTFQDVFTSIVDIGKALELIIQNTKKHSNGIGIIKIKAKRVANSIELEIIDVHSTATKEFDIFRNGIKDNEFGDFSRIANRLKGICDFSVQATFPLTGNQSNEIFVLSKKHDYKSLKIKPLGFTYKLIFYKPLKILLLDDGDKKQRIKQLDYINKDSKLQRIIDLETEYKGGDLSIYNYLLVHKNLEKKSELINDFVSKNNVSIVRFSGGTTQNSKIQGKNDITLSEDDFYDNLGFFLEACLGNDIEPYEIFSKLVSKNKIIPNDSLIKLLDDIRFEKIDLKSIPSEYKKRIEKMIGNEIDLPPFESFRQLKNYIEDNLKK